MLVNLSSFQQIKSVQEKQIEKNKNKCEERNLTFDFKYIFPHALFAGQYFAASADEIFGNFCGTSFTVATMGVTLR